MQYFVLTNFAAKFKRSGKDVFLTHFIEQQFTLEEKFIEILKK